MTAEEKLNKVERKMGNSERVLDAEIIVEQFQAGYDKELVRQHHYATNAKINKVKMDNWAAIAPYMPDHVVCKTGLKMKVKN